MLRLLLVLLIGVAAGYAYGFKDAQVHEAPVQRRVSQGFFSREHVKGKAKQHFDPLAEPPTRNDGKIRVTADTSLPPLTP